MKKIIALRIVLIIALAGMSFAGFLSYSEIIRKSCAVGGCWHLLGIPVCLYGFTMYTLIVIITLIGLCSKKK